MNEESPIVTEIRERAMQISKRFGHDPHQYAKHLREKEKGHPERIVNQVTVVRHETSQSGKC